MAILMQRSAWTVGLLIPGDLQGTFFAVTRFFTVFFSTCQIISYIKGVYTHGWLTLSGLSALTFKGGRLLLFHENQIWQNFYALRSW